MNDIPDSPGRDPFPDWYRAAEKRYLADLTFSEVRRAVQALSLRYVQRGRRVGAALDGAGKRAAFGVFYGPLHFLVVREAVRRFAQGFEPATIVDLGCGTGVAGAAWAVEAAGAHLSGIDRSSWAAAEARWTYRTMGLRGSARRGDLIRAPLGGAGTAIVAAYTINELGEAERDRLRGRLLRAGGRGAAVLVVEPIARRVSPWWDGWGRAWAEAGGSAHEWRFPAELPDSLRLMDRAAGLDHRELSARSLWLDGRSSAD